MAKRPRPAASIESIRSSGATPESILGAIILDDGALADWLASMLMGAGAQIEATVGPDADQPPPDDPAGEPPRPLKFGGLIQHSLYGDPVLRLEWGEAVNVDAAPAAAVLDLSRGEASAGADPDLIRADYAASANALANAQTGMAASAGVTVEAVISTPGALGAAATVFMDGRSLVAALAKVPTEGATPTETLTPLFANLRLPPDIAMTIAGDGDTIAEFLTTIRSDVFALARVLGGAFADASAPIAFIRSLAVNRVVVFMRWQRRA